MTEDSSSEWLFESGPLFFQAEVKTEETILKIEVWHVKDDIPLLNYRLSTEKPATIESKAHPFMLLVEQEDEEIDLMQETVPDNELSRTLFNWIAKPREEMGEKCGFFGADIYRAQMVKALGFLYVTPEF
jgi:hypothetical protein